MKDIVLENENIKLVFNGENGALEGLTAVKLGGISWGAGTWAFFPVVSPHARQAQ